MSDTLIAWFQVTCFSNFYAADPYIGTRMDEVKKKNEEIAALQKEVKMLKLDLHWLQCLLLRRRRFRS